MEYSPPFITLKVIPPKRLKLTLPVVLGLSVMAISIYGYAVMKGYVDHDKWTDSLWPYHDRKTAVLYKQWAAGTYKNCRAANEETGFELLECEKVDPSKDGGVFAVRFRGRVYMKEIHSDWLDWKCRNDGDPVELRITCWPMNR